MVPIALALGPGAPVLIGTIAKGKKGNVLKIDAMVTSEALAFGAPWTINAGVIVGIPASATLSVKMEKKK